MTIDHNVFHATNSGLVQVQMADDIKSLPAHQLLEQEGNTLVVFHPGSRILHLGFGNDAQPHAVSHCLAYHDLDAARRQHVAIELAKAVEPPFAAVEEAAAALGLKAPPAPSDKASQSQLKAQEQPEDAAEFQWTQWRRGPETAAAADGDGVSSTGRGCSGQAEAAAAKPWLFGSEVTSLPPDAPYTVVWPMAGGQLQALGKQQQWQLRDRLESLWRWALRHELGLGDKQWTVMGAVLVVPDTMCAEEVRLLADVLLSNLGFASLVVHLEPVAATFGHGATTACVVNIGPESTSICCVEDGAVWPQTRVQLGLGTDDVAAALQHWLGKAGLWPGGERREEGYAVPSVGPGAVPCERAALESFRDRHCYFPKESSDPSLAGQAMLEDENVPAPLLLRAPGKPTLSYQLPLGTWACLAPMCMFHPSIAPAPSTSNGRDTNHSSDSNGTADMEVDDAEGLPAAADAAAAAAGSVATPADAGGGDAAAVGTPAVSSGTAAVVPGSAATAAASSGAEGSGAAWDGPAVDELPTAERQYFMAQQRARMEAGDLGRPPVAAYLPLASVGLERVGEGAGGGVAGGGGVEQATAVPARTPLDEAVFSSVESLSADRLELRQRLFAGILVVGQGSGLRGLNDMLERRVLHALPNHSAVELVAVLEPHSDPRFTIWKGAALLAVLDRQRDNWLGRQQWVHPAPGTNRHMKLFYYLKAQQGVA